MAVEGEYWGNGGGSIFLQVTAIFLSIWYFRFGTELQTSTVYMRLHRWHLMGHQHIASALTSPAGCALSSVSTGAPLKQGRFPGDSQLEIENLGRLLIIPSLQNV